MGGRSLADWARADGLSKEKLLLTTAAEPFRGGSILDACVLSNQLGMNLVIVDMHGALLFGEGSVTPRLMLRFHDQHY
eukprot:2767787-Amphidinium_carterae.1